MGEACNTQGRDEICIRNFDWKTVQLLGYRWTIGVLWFDSRRGLGIFLFTTASRTALELTRPPVQWVPGALSLGVKRPGREAGHSPPSSAEVKECVELYLRSSNTPPWRGDQLKNHFKPEGRRPIGSHSLSIVLVLE